MKKIFRINYILLAVALSALAVACSDDTDSAGGGGNSGSLGTPVGVDTEVTVNASVVDVNEQPIDVDWSADSKIAIYSQSDIYGVYNIEGSNSGVSSAATFSGVVNLSNEDAVYAHYPTLPYPTASNNIEIEVSDQKSAKQYYAGASTFTNSSSNITFNMKPMLTTADFSFKVPADMDMSDLQRVVFNSSSLYTSRFLDVANVDGVQWFGGSKGIEGLVFDKSVVSMSPAADFNTYTLSAYIFPSDVKSIEFYFYDSKNIKIHEGVWTNVAELDFSKGGTVDVGVIEYASSGSNGESNIGGTDSGGNLFEPQPEITQPDGDGSLEDVEDEVIN